MTNNKSYRQLINKCELNIMNNENNGLITSIWGPPIWDASFLIAFGFPLKPTEEQKINYMNHFINLGNVLPCKYCRQSFQEFLATTNKLTIDDLESRHTLIKWLFEMRNTINKKLGMNYGVTLSDVYERFEPSRSSCGIVDKQAKGCVTPLYQKSIAYKNMYYHDPPIILFTTMKVCMEIARMKNYPESFFEFFEIVKNYQCNLEVLKKLPIWQKRREECSKILWDMKINGYENIEQEGTMKGYPTDIELRLFGWMSTSLRQEQLCEMIRNVFNSHISFDYCINNCNTIGT